MAHHSNPNHDPRHGPARPAEWIDKIAELFDTKYTLPGTQFRFGLDPIIGVIPVVGDTATFLIGAAMLYESRRLRLGWGTGSLIVINLMIDWLVGLIPGLDLVFDSLYKGHRRNADLIHRRAERAYPAGGVPPKKVPNEAAGGTHATA